MIVLGIGGLLHDGAAAVLKDGTCVAAIEEEKLLRQRHPGGLPVRAIESCLDIVGLHRDDVELLALARPMESGSGQFLHLHLKTIFPQARVVIVDHHILLYIQRIN